SFSRRASYHGRSLMQGVSRFSDRIRSESPSTVGQPFCFLRNDQRLEFEGTNDKNGTQKSIGGLRTSLPSEHSAKESKKNFKLAILEQAPGDLAVRSRAESALKGSKRIRGGLSTRELWGSGPTDICSFSPFHGRCSDDC